MLVKEEAKRRIKLGCAAAGALVAALLITTCPIPGLSYQATAVLGILIMAIVWWITGVLPEFVTAVVMAVLFVVVAGISVGATFSTFASSTWWLLLSAFTLGVGMKTSGLMRRIALAIVRKFPRTFRCQVIAQLVTGTVLGPLIPSLAVKGAMLAPLAMSIGDELGYERQGKRATGLFAAMLVGIRTVAPTIVSASVTGYALMATLPADVQEQFNMASWFVAALPWLVVVLALNYFLIMGMYGRGEASACDAVEDSPSDTVGAPGNAQSLEQSSLRCGTRFVGAAECADSRQGEAPGTVGAPGNAQSLEQSSLRCGTRFVGAAKCADSKQDEAESSVAEPSRGGTDLNDNQSIPDGLGPLSVVEKRMLAIILMTVVLWATEPFHHISAMAVGLAALVFMFVLKVIDVLAFKSGVNWTSLLFIGIALGLGSVFAEAGLNDWVMQTCGPAFQALAGNPYLLVLGIGVITVVLRFLIVSEVAYLNLLMAFLVPMAASVGVNPWVLGFSAYALVIAWFAKYQSPIYLAAFYAVDGKMAKHSELAKYCGVYLATCLAGLVVCVPYWQWMGLL
ncbi:SLC13 family permease [Ellagibacter isourolithinifaciens]|uniref:SLC13 family permease n=1 Tax=Ellagibacter isourolithinifaciens TaxID=2137581 RepID=UPI003F8C1AA2